MYRRFNRLAVVDREMISIERAFVITKKKHKNTRDCQGWNINAQKYSGIFAISQKRRHAITFKPI